MSRVAVKPTLASAILTHRLMLWIRTLQESSQDWAAPPDIGVLRSREVVTEPQLQAFPLTGKHARDTWVHHVTEPTADRQHITPHGATSSPSEDTRRLSNIKLWQEQSIHEVTHSRHRKSSHDLPVRP